MYSLKSNSWIPIQEIDIPLDPEEPAIAVHGLLCWIAYHEANTRLVQ